MKITEITVSNQYTVTPGSTFTPGIACPTNDPFFEVTAKLQDGDDVDACTKELQERVEAGLAQHAQKIRDIYAVNQKIAEDKAKEQDVKQGDNDARRAKLLRDLQFDAMRKAAGAIKPGTLSDLPDALSYMAVAKGFHTLIADELDKSSSQSGTTGKADPFNNPFNQLKKK